MRILYLDLDALNPDHLSCYGYHRQTSPTIDKIASQGVRFDEVYTCDAPCLPSRTAFYSGRLGIQTGVVGHGRSASQPKLQDDRAFRDAYTTQGLAGRLMQNGFHTAMVSPFGDRHSAHWFYAGFNEIHNTGKIGMESAEEVTPTVAKWLDDHAADDNWYLHVNYWDIHTPYRAPMDYGNPFENEPLPAWLTDEVIAEHAKKTGPHSANELGMFSDADSPRYPRVPAKATTREGLKAWIDGYDTAIRYVDDQVKLISDKLEAAGVLDDTVIIISSDHGENQGQLGIYGEHGTADRATCHIPMIIRWPGQASGHVDAGLHYNLDVAPTLMDMLGLKASPIWDGQSFADTLRQQADAGREDLVISQCCHVCQRGVRWDNWLYIRTYHDGFHLFPQEMLFDLANDPNEQHDLAPTHRTQCLEGAYRLMRWHDTQMQKMTRTASDSVDPMWTVIRDGGPEHARHAPPSPLPQYIERLEATGRTDGAAELRQRYAAELKAMARH